MSTPWNRPNKSVLQPTMPVPTHWSTEQALAVFVYLQVVRQAWWAVYGSQVPQAWRDQLMHDGPPPEFDPDQPF